jgi:hypothetical protein
VPIAAVGTVNDPDMCPDDLGVIEVGVVVIETVEPEDVRK